MLFNTIDFIIFFILIISLLIVIKNRKFQHSILLIGSFFFFYYSNNYLIVLLIFSTLLDFYVGKEIYRAEKKSRKKLLLYLTIAGNLGMLGFFKYADFTIDQINSSLSSFNMASSIPHLDLILPIGISFYTFQSLSYSIDIYRGNLVPSKSLREYSLFVAFFPSLVAGPIIRAKDFLPQLREKINEQNTDRLKQILVNNSNLKFGITLMAIGFFKKMFFADNISPLVNSIFANPIGFDSSTIFLGAIASGIQIYCDFSGYSDIAIGAALIIGIKIPKNFNKPFFATSPSNFWERWHISLSTWGRDYLYFPLVFKRRKSIVFVACSVFFTMIVLGLWHGAGWNFIIFGAIHGLIIAGHRLLTYIMPEKIKNSFKSKIGILISICITQYFVFLSWIPFRIDDFNKLIYAMEKFIILDIQFSQLFHQISLNLVPFSLIILFGILHFISYKKSDLISKITNLKLPYWTIFLSIMMLCIFFFYDGNSEDFIYFQF